MCAYAWTVLYIRVNCFLHTHAVSPADWCVGEDMKGRVSSLEY